VIGTGSRLAESHNGPRPLPHKGFGREGDRPLSLARVAGEGGTISGADGGVRADPKRERGSDRSFCGIARPSPLALSFTLGVRRRERGSDRRADSGMIGAGAVSSAVEQWTFNPLVEGSNPSRPTIPGGDCRFRDPGFVHRLLRQSPRRPRANRISRHVVAQIGRRDSA
jgi:hypothetical protein